MLRKIIIELFKNYFEKKNRRNPIISKVKLIYIKSNKILRINIYEKYFFIILFN